MNAAIALAKSGIQVVVLDRAERAGGQIFRKAGNSPLPQSGLLGPDYTDGATLIEVFEKCGATHMAGADVWHLGEDGTVLYSAEGETRQLQAREVLICPGAMERPMPISGWTLPGVMTAGAAQVMLKSDAIVAQGAVFAGSGPLLYLIVAQYLRLGVKVAAMVDTTPRANYTAALAHGSGALRSWPILRKGLSLMREISASGVPVYKYATDLKISGEYRATGLAFNVGGREKQVSADTVFLHHGVIPNSNMTRALQLVHEWNAAQQCWQVKTNRWGQSTVPHVSVAGDGAGIIGADGAQSAGRLAALNILARLGKLSEAERDKEARQDHTALRKLASFRRFIDRLYRPMEALQFPREPDTLVCRCEDQSLQDLRNGFEKGARDPNALKSLTRCGMGPCQGRQCGPMVSALLAKWRDEPESQVGYFRLRSPQRLLNLEEFSRFQRVQASSMDSEKATE
jgi:NADPH-dependent 2,4-dienoyl-CoA reductase/sulfur reductase-like enzyme